MFYQFPFDSGPDKKGQNRTYLTRAGPSSPWPAAGLEAARTPSGEARARPNLTDWPAGNRAEPSAGFNGMGRGSSVQQCSGWP